jgi:hypothetical protein
MGADIQELHEHAEHAASEPALIPVTITMAVLAVIGAIVSMMGARVHADEMLKQTQAADQWSQYQAEKIRQRSYMVLLDELNLFALQNAANVPAIKAKYQSEIDRYTKQTNDIQTQANATQDEVKSLEKKSNLLDYAEAIIESSLVICSITLLTQKKVYWYAGMLIGAGGSVLATIAFLIR